MFCSWCSPYILRTHFAPLWKAREDTHGCFSLGLFTHLQSRAISSHPAPGLRSFSLSSCGWRWNVGFRPFSSLWLCCKHTSQLICVSPDLVLSKLCFSQDSKARARPHFSRWQRHYQASKPCLLCNGHSVNSSF